MRKSFYFYLTDVHIKSWYLGKQIIPRTDYTTTWYIYQMLFANELLLSR